MQNNLDYKLNRVETSIDTIKHNLALEPTAPIEDVVTATEFNLKKMMNIFIQQEEPETKDGLWLKTDPFDYDVIKVDETYQVEGKIIIDPENNPAASCRPSVYGGGIQYKDDFYWLTTGKLHYFDKQAQTIKEIPEFATALKASGLTMPSYSNCATILDDVLYIYTPDNLIHYYNMKTHEYSTFATEVNTSKHFMFGYEDKLYFISHFGYTDVQSHSISVKTHKVVKTFDNAPFYITVRYGYLPFVGGRQLVAAFTSMGNQRGMFWFDPVEYTYTKDTHSDMGNFLPSRETSVFVYDNYLYYGGSNSYFRILDLTDYTYDAYNSYSLTSTFGLDTAVDTVVWIDDGKMYLVDSRQQTCPTATFTTPCDENTLVLRQGVFKGGITQNIALYSVPTTVGKIVWPIYDVAYYKDGKYNTAFTVYYGNGTSWNKLK
jgi:hypothetical protein